MQKNEDSVSRQANRDRINELVREHYALELLELRERIADLESTMDAYRALAQEALHALQQVTAERDTARRALTAARQFQRSSPRRERTEAA